MNKKALVLSTIIGIIIAALILVPACTLGARMFRLSDQAQENFASFVDELNDLGEKGREGEKRGFTLIMDKTTGIYLFPANSIEIERVAIDSPIVSSYIQKIYFKRPESCSLNKACACLCQDYVVRVKDLGTVRKILEVELDCDSKYCQEINYNLPEMSARASELGEVEYDFSPDLTYYKSDYDFSWLTLFTNRPGKFYVKGGYVLERHTEKELFAIRWGNFDYRRKFLTLTKTPEELQIKEQGT